MTTPGSTSGTYNFGLSNAQVILEAFERCGVHDPAIVRNNLISARVSLNLELQRFSSPARGINLWKEVYGTTINLVTGQSDYTLSPNVMTITEVWYTTVNGNGTGQNSDRIMVPLTRTQYAMIPNKETPGIPTQYWFERLETPVLHVWEPPSQGAPSYVLTYNYLERIQDANLGSGETPDVIYRALDVLCARLAMRLAPKVVPRAEWAAVLPVLKAYRDEAEADFTSDDQEQGAMTLVPNVAGYSRMGTR